MYSGLETLRDHWGALAAAVLVSAVLAATHSSPVPLSYDFGGHLSRMYVLLHDGLGWTGMWYNGYHLFHFYPPLYYFTSLPVALLSFDLLRPFSFALVGFTGFISMYYFSVRRIGRKRSIAAGLLFLSGWMMYVIQVSGSMPQALAAALAPAFYSELLEALDGGSPVTPALLASAIMLLHHNAAVVVGLGAAVYLFLNLEKNFLNAAFSGLLGLLMASFWLVPALWEFGDASYGAFPYPGSRGVESVVAVSAVFAIPLSLKLAASLDSIVRHRQEAVLALTGLVLSLGVSAALTQYLPVISRMPPYRIFLLTAFSASFLAAASRARILLPALALCIFFSYSALDFHDDRGFGPGQREAYEYIGDSEVDLLYDAEDTDIRAYAITVHGKDIADGWSVGSTAIRPGLERFDEWQREGDPRATEFLVNWSVDHVITYRDTPRNSNLHRLVNGSSYYRLERCFREVCVFNSSSVPAVRNVEAGYVASSAGQLPVPYSRHFNGVEKTPNGFMYADEPGRIDYRRLRIHRLGLSVSGAALIVSVILWLTGFRVPVHYSKVIRHPLHHVRDCGRGKSRPAG